MGWGVVEYRASAYTYVGAGVVQTAAATAHIQRLTEITVALTQVLQQYQPDLLCVERVFINTNLKTSLLLGEARGASIATLLQAQKPIAEISALQIKRSLTGQGRASKKQVANMVYRLLNLTPTTPLASDSLDALACAIAGHAFHQTAPMASSFVPRRYRPHRQKIPTLRELARQKL